MPTAPAPSPVALLFVGVDGIVTSASGDVRCVFGRDVEGAHVGALLGDLDWAAAGARDGTTTASLARPSGEHESCDVEIRRFVEGDRLVKVVARRRESGVPPPWDRRISPLSVPLDEGFVEAQRRFMLAVLDADPNLVFVKDAEGRFMFANAALGRDLGRAPEAVVAQSNAAVHPHVDELERFADVDREVLATGREACVEEPFTLPSGEVLWYETRKRPLVAPDGKTYVLAVSTDVTARRAAERKLEEVGERLELAVAAGHLGLWDWNLTTNEVFFDARWKAMIGYAEHELANDFRVWEEALHRDDRTRVLQNVERAVADPRATSFENEFRMRRKDGGWEWLSGSGAISRGADGRATRVTGFHLDVQDRKEREAALELANENLARAARMKDEFLANMSHELRTPLNAVLGQSELLTEEIHGPITAAQRRAIEMIERSGLHLLQLINDILDLAKLGAEKLTLDRHSVDLGALCREAFALVRADAAKKSLRVAFSDDGLVPTIDADPGRLRQVLVNLLANAVRFTDAGGRLGLEVHGAPGAVRIAVWDSGIGISAEQARALFQPFVQLDAGLARKHGGAGLGLALAKGLVELHGGTLSLESEPGRGARFVVELPRA